MHCSDVQHILSAAAMYQWALKQQSTALCPFKTQDFLWKSANLSHVRKGISPGDLGPLHREATLYFLTSPWIWKGNIWKADDIFHKLPSRFCVVLENVYSRECPQHNLMVLMANICFASPCRRSETRALICLLFPYRCALLSRARRTDVACKCLSERGKITAGRGRAQWSSSEAQTALCAGDVLAMASLLRARGLYGSCSLHCKWNLLLISLHSGITNYRIHNI